MNCLLDLATCLQASEGGQTFAICAGFVVISLVVWGLHAFLSIAERSGSGGCSSANQPRTAARLTPYDRHQPVYQPPRPPSPPPPKPQPTRTSRASGRKPTIVTNGSPKRRPIPRQEPLPPVEWGPWRNN
jgi:hypothetical protein